MSKKISELELATSVGEECCIPVVVEGITMKVMLKVLEENLKGDPGKDGEDGTSPTISVSKITGGNRISITDVHGTKYIDVMDGSSGQNGKDGEDGEDGVGIKSIAQTTTSTADGGENVFTVTLTNGVTGTFKVKNGSKGSNGSDATVTLDNIKNALGYTPANADDVPTKTSQLTNDSDFVKRSEIPSEAWGESVLEIVPITIEWDGNTEGCDTWGSGASIAYKVSDEIIRGEEFQCSGATVTYENGTSLGVASSGIVEEKNGSWYHTWYGVGCVFDGELAGVPEGIYFSAYNWSEGGIPVSVGPLSVEKLKKEYLPDHEHEGGTVDMSKYFETVGGDTLTWDGNTEGLEVDSVTGMFYRISDITPSIEDLQNGGRVTATDGTIDRFNSDGVIDASTVGIGDGCAIVCGGFGLPFLVAYKDNASATFEEIPLTLPKAGIYALGVDSEEGKIYIDKITINGYSGFYGNETIKKEYLPHTNTVRTIAFRDIPSCCEWLSKNYDREIIKFMVWENDYGYRNYELNSWTHFGDTEIVQEYRFNRHEYNMSWDEDVDKCYAFCSFQNFTLHKSVTEAKCRREELSYKISKDGATLNVENVWEYTNDEFMEKCMEIIVLYLD